MNRKPDAGLSRRSLAALCGAAPALAALATVPTTESLDAFVALSSRLTGFAPRELDRSFATHLLLALIDRGDDLAALRAGDDDAELAADVIAAWYSGILPAARQPIVATFHDALIWQALHFAKPPSVCGTAGAWASRPPPAA